ncbi:MAG TPA: hypothetical protein DEO84_02465 [candidate division Zixibacteria bacterium]|nr:hypothetical protein [candidate division Zixibacteria bacterium]
MKRSWVILILLALAIIFACGEKMKLPTEVPPTGNLGDTLFLMLNPPWDAAHGYTFAKPTCIYFGKDTYLYVVDTTGIYQLDAAGSVNGYFQIDHPLSVSQDEFMRLLVVTGEKKIYKIDVGPGGDRTPLVTFDYTMPQRYIATSDTGGYFFKLRSMIGPDDRFISITDIPANDNSYLVAVSSEHINNARVLWFHGTSQKAEYTDSLFDRIVGVDPAIHRLISWTSIGDTLINPIIITGNGVTTTTHPNSIYTYQLSGATHLIVCQDSGSYPVHDLTLARQVWDQHWVFNYTHSPSETDLLKRGFFSLPKGATVDLQGNIYVVDAGSDRFAVASQFTKQGKFIRPIEQLYSAIDIDDNEGLTYNWIEINPHKGGSGASAGLGQNSNLWVPLGSRFYFYTTPYDSIDISSNGWCTFLPSAQQPTRPPIPNTSEPNALVSPFGQALGSSDASNGIYYWHDQATGIFVVQYDSILNAGNNTSNTFQLLLNPADSSVTFQYKYSTAWGDSATIGIESANGSKGLTIPISRIRNGYAVKFRMATQMLYPSGITYDIYGDRRTVFIADTGNNRILRYKLSTDLEQ